MPMDKGKLKKNEKKLQKNLDCIVHNLYICTIRLIEQTLFKRPKSPQTPCSSGLQRIRDIKKSVS